MPHKVYAFHTVLAPFFLFLIVSAVSGEPATQIAVLPLSRSVEFESSVPRMVRHRIAIRLAESVQIVQANAQDIENAVGAPWHPSYQLSPGTVASVARNLGTSAAVYGSVFRSGSDVRITVRLVEGTTGESVIEIARKSSPDSASILAAVDFIGEVLRGRIGSISPIVPPAPALSVITVAGIPEGARLSIDGDSVGTTPYTDSSFAPGVHLIALDADRYEHFEREIEFPAGQPRKIRVRMRPKYGGIMVLGTPDEATVELNDSISGTIPFHHDSLTPGAYLLSVSSPAYQSISKQIRIERGQIDTMEISLVTQAYLDSLRHAGRLRRRTARRITFGALGVAFAGAGFLVDREIARRAEEADAAYDLYNKPGLTASEYDLRYSTYLDAYDDVGKPERARNILYVLAGVSGVGFAVSIPF